jgi:hypothetical protein
MMPLPRNLLVGAVVFIGASSPAEAQEMNLTGEVLTPSGVPVSNAKVLAMVDNGVTLLDEILAETCSDANGKFTITLPQFHSHVTLIAVDHKHGPGILSCRFESLPQAKSVVLTLSEPTAVIGEVLTEDGLPVSNACVYVVLLNSAGDPPKPIPGNVTTKFFRTYTSWDGKFQITNLPLAAFGYMQAYSTTPIRGASSICAFTAAKTSSPLTLRIKPYSRIEGRVISENDKKPVSNANIRLLPITLPWIPHSITKSDSEGHFIFMEVPAGAYKICLMDPTESKPLSIRQAVEVWVAPDETCSNVVLQTVSPAHLLIKTTCEDTDAPYPHVTVEIVSPTGSVCVKGATDSTGKFIAAVPPDSYLVRFSIDNEVQKAVPLTAKSGETNVIEQIFSKRKKIAARVVTPDGSPLPYPKVLIIDSEGEQQVAQCYSNGMFTYKPLSWGDFSQETLEEVTIIISSPTSNLILLTNLTSPCTETMELCTTPGVMVTGTINFEGELPKQVNLSAYLLLEIQSAEEYRLFNLRMNPTNAQALPIKLGGLFPHLPQVIEISCDGYVPAVIDIPIADTNSSVDFGTVTMKQAKYSICGQVIDKKGQPLTNRITILAKSLHENGPTLETNTDSHGRFVIGGLFEGPAVIEAFSENGNTALGSTLAQAGTTNVLLIAGERCRAITGKRLRRISGIIKTPDGKPVAGAKVALVRYSGLASVTTDSAGEFVLPYFAPSRFASETPSETLVAWYPEAQLAAIAEEEGEENEPIEITLAQTIKVSGRSEDPLKEPIPNARIFVRLALDGYELVPWQTQTDSSGRFVVEGLPHPKSMLTICITNSGYLSIRTNIVPEENVTCIDLGTLTLQPRNLAVTGKVLDPDEKPASKVSILGWITSYQGELDEFLYGIETDANGNFIITNLAKGQSVELKFYSKDCNALLTVPAGASNIIVQLKKSPRRHPSRPTAKHASTTVDLTEFHLPTEVTNQQWKLICVFDPEQRPSKHLLRQLSEQFQSITNQNVQVIGIWQPVTDKESFQAWRQSCPVPFPVGFRTNASEKTQWIDQIESLPYLLLLNPQGRTAVKNLELEELEATLTKHREQSP